MDLCTLFLISVLNHGYNPSVSVVIITSGLFAQSVCRSDPHWCTGPQFSVDQTDSKQLNIWGWGDFHIFPISCFVENIQWCNNEVSITPSTSYALYEYKAKNLAGPWGKKRQVLPCRLLSRIIVKGLKPGSSSYFPGTLSHS